MTSRTRHGLTQSEMLADVLRAVRQNTPLVHCVTNYVTVNDCANIILAAGGSPIMADDTREVAQIASLCAALVLNIGTLNERTVPAMLAAGKRANQLGRPVVLDPVGAGASDLRNETLQDLLREVRFTAIKGNSSEMGFLAGGLASARGVDADAGTLVTEDNLAAKARLARELSTRTGAVAIISGPLDIVAGADKAWAVRNGHPLMARITGSGCMTTALMGCCLGAVATGAPRAKALSEDESNAHTAVHTDNALLACLCAMCAMGVCGELAAERMERGADSGTGTYRALLMDAMSTLDADALATRARVEPLAR